MKKISIIVMIVGLLLACLGLGILAMPNNATVTSIVLSIIGSSLFDSGLISIVIIALSIIGSVLFGSGLISLAITQAFEKKP